MRRKNVFLFFFYDLALDTVVVRIEHASTTRFEQQRSNRSAVRGDHVVFKITYFTLNADGTKRNEMVLFDMYLIISFKTNEKYRLENNDYFLS